MPKSQSRSLCRDNAAQGSAKQSAGDTEHDDHERPPSEDTPLRISFAGGGTDVSPFPETEGDAALSATTHRYVLGSLATHAHSHLSIESRSYGISLNLAPEDGFAPDGRQYPVKAATRRVGRGRSQLWDRSFLLCPTGSGLGCSSAMVVTVVALLNEYSSIRHVPHQQPISYAGSSCQRTRCRTSPAQPRASDSLLAQDSNPPVRRERDKPLPPAIDSDNLWPYPSCPGHRNSSSLPAPHAAPDPQFVPATPSDPHSRHVVARRWPSRMPSHP
jgi:hypothetical protein